MNWFGPSGDCGCCSDLVCGCLPPSAVAVSGTCCGETWGTISPTFDGPDDCGYSEFVWTNPSTNYCVDYCETISAGEVAFVERASIEVAIGGFSAGEYLVRLNLEGGRYQTSGCVRLSDFLYVMNFVRDCDDGTGVMTFLNNSGSFGSVFLTCTKPTVTITI